MGFRSLKDKEQAILKLPVFFDGYDNYYHPIRESVVNCRDVLLDKEDGVIEVVLHDDNQTVTVKDNGCGLPMDGESEGIPNWVHAFLKLFSGTKMETGRTSGGTNGCGNTIINYSSTLMDVISSRPDGNTYHIRFKDGGEVAEEFNIIGHSEQTGTVITFRLDPTIYTCNVFDEREVEGIVDRIVATSPNIKAIFKYRDYIKEYNYASIKDYMNSKKEDNLYEDIIMNNKQYESEFYNLDKKEQDIEYTNISMVMNFCKENPFQHPFLNGIYLPVEEEASNYIRRGVLEGLKKIFNDFIKNEGMYDKKEKQITREDIKCCLSYVINVNSTNVVYTSQSKFSTKKELYDTQIRQFIKDFMETYIIENKEIVKQIANRILINKRSREKSEFTRNKVKQDLEKTVNTASNRPKKFTPCVSKDKSKRRLALMEGNSALTPILKSRDKRYLALYALKGKIIGCIKNDIDDILNNQEIRDIFKILGCGMEYNGKIIKGIKKYCEEDLQYEEIDIMSDFDADGVGHIAPLVICMFYILAPKIIENGHLFILNTPLYGIEYKGNIYYAYSDKEKDEIINKYNMNNSRKVSRYKGLGSLSTQNLIDTAMNEEHCVKDKVTIESAESCLEALMLCFSDERKDDRKFILETRGSEFTDMMEVQ